MDVEIIPSEYKILIIDDIQSNIILLQAMLRHNKYNTISAMSGMQGLELLDREEPDLVLLDVMMPDINGYEVAEKIRSNPLMKDLPIIFVTALNDPTNIVEGFKHGCNDYVSKPFNASEILIRIRHQLSLVASRRIILKQTQVLQNTIKERDGLYSVIAHDLRSPLGSMKMVLNMLVDALSAEQIGDEYYDLLTSADKTTEELFLLLDNLLKWTKNQLGRLNVVFQDFDFSKIVSGVVEILQPMASMSNISLNLTTDCTDEVHGDIDMVKTIIRNLILNAIKFSHSGYSIEIHTYTQGDDAVCDVIDHGIGITEENQESLRKAISITTVGARKEEGSGLGLQLCREFTEKNNGKFWFKSVQDEGSTFSFSLPIVKAPAE
jgi:two-component system sensor histidine kinase/response regulator